MALHCERASLKGKQLCEELGQGLLAKWISPRAHTYPSSQKSGLRRLHGWRANRPRPKESTQCSHLLAKCTHSIHLDLTFQDRFQAALWIGDNYCSANTRLTAQLQDNTIL